MTSKEHSACGVGFVASLQGHASHEHLQRALTALRAVEHRGATGRDGQSSDGAGVMTEIPFAMLGRAPGTIAVATLFLSADQARRERVLRAFEETFAFMRVPVLEYRSVPTNPEVLGPLAAEGAPHIVQAILQRPEHSRTDAAFNTLLYQAKQRTRVRLAEIGAWFDLYFISLSTTTIVYKALCTSGALDQFYPDLANPRYATRFALFHRRFSTNTRTTWDRAQPFRMIAHNGEINTITANRSVAYSREHAMGLSSDELLTHSAISDSGSFNEMVEALKYRSSIPHLDDILAIMMPPADHRGPFHTFWGRAMEPWDGPALIVYSNGETVGARLDRNGFRPARWCMTEDAFYLASEAGVFGLSEASIERKGTLRAGSGATVQLPTGRVHFRDPSESRENRGATFDPRLVPIAEVPDHLDREVLAHAEPELTPRALDRLPLFSLTTEEIDRILVPMIVDAKEPIGSMGDTARPAIFSDEVRSLYDFFAQRFAQVTNPPLDYLREGMVTDLQTFLGIRPNIFAPKELIPPAPCITLSRPLLSLRQMQIVRLLQHKRPSDLRTLAAVLDCTFDRAGGAQAFDAALRRLEQEAIDRVGEGIAVLVLSDRTASYERPPLPSLLALRAVVCALNRVGGRLRASVVLEAGDVRTTHQVACAIGFGATAVCPYVALELARFHRHPKLDGIYGPAKEDNVLTALCQGLLKVMSKMGISVVRSYQSSKLFAAFGLGPQLVARYFDGVESPLGGLELPEIAEAVCRAAEVAQAEPSAEPLRSTYQLKEKNREDEGERHSMTARRSKLVHLLVRGSKKRPAAELEREYIEAGEDSAPVSPRHLLALREVDAPIPLEEVEPAAAIMARFGEGAMSFGAISAEAQRDLFVAMRRVGGRCNSGEGGENPYYYLDGTTATTKQVASGRFGVTAEYLAAADEIEIKIAQGAKPGEGGQLMGVKVDEHIARARHASPGVDLISPPPLHDIYSIEDLKQLIYELGQLRPGVPVCVKLVAGAHIGTIAVGVVKAGAKVIQISGNDGGTGAATISSMKHAGWPFELGLIDVHKTLVEHGLRSAVRLRVDGGLSTGKDVVLAAALGAEEFGFGKLLLVAQGCIMARVCEKNRCPTGIATHDPKFKAKYKGTPEHVEHLLRTLAEQVRRHLAAIGVRSLDEVIGHRRFLRADPRHVPRVERTNLDLFPMLEPLDWDRTPISLGTSGHSRLNARIIDDVLSLLDAGKPVRGRYDVANVDRAAISGLAGELARRSHRARMGDLDGKTPNYTNYYPEPGSIGLELTGSAGQGFAAFVVDGVDVRLVGEANDSVAKSMSGGRVVIVPPPSARFDPHDNAIIGNGALYGATGGTLFVHGCAGDRFAVRNSGAQAVVEGAGLHACEYMTGGTIVVLGPVRGNAGAGMTGGVLWLPRDQAESLSRDYVVAMAPDDLDLTRLRRLLSDYVQATGSKYAEALVGDSDRLRRTYFKVVPHGVAASLRRRNAAS